MILPSRCAVGSPCWGTCIVRWSQADSPYWLPLLLIRGRFKTLAHPQALSRQVQATSSFLAATYTSLQTAEAPVVPTEPLDFSTARNVATCTTSSSGLRSNLGRTPMSE